VKRRPGAGQLVSSFNMTSVAQSRSVKFHIHPSFQQFYDLNGVSKDELASPRGCA